MRIARAWPLVLAALALAPGSAEAQFRRGGGLGFGYGFSPYYYSPAQPERLLYRRAMLNASRASMGPTVHGIYDGRPAAYPYHLHDPGYLDGIDVATRRRIEARIGRFSDGPPTPEPPGRPVAPPPSPRRPPRRPGPARRAGRGGALPPRDPGRSGRIGPGRPDAVRHAPAPR